MNILAKGDYYLRGITSIRFFLALLVVLLHCNRNLADLNIYWYSTLPFLNKGSFAVDCFFMLSGYLLTYLAIREYKQTGKIVIREFFMRRMLRIFPLYYLAVFLGFLGLGVLYPMLKGEQYFSFDPQKGIYYYLFFLPNWITAKYAENVGAINSLWSIGVEEQFYILFPFLMATGMKSNRLLLLFVTAYLVYLSFYSFAPEINFIAEHQTVTRFIDLLKFHLMFIGGVFAIIYEKYQSLISKWIAHPLIRSVLFAGIILIFFTYRLDNFSVLKSWLFCAFLIALHNFPKSYFITENRILVYLGKISYGIYIFHGMVTYLIRHGMESSEYISDIISTFPYFYYLFVMMVTIVVAHFSYTYYEKKFLKMKFRYSNLK